MNLRNSLVNLIVLFAYSTCLSATNLNALIIEGTASDHEGSFMALKRNLTEWDFDVKQYVTDNSFGAGLEIEIGEINLKDYDVVLVSVHQGTFSNNLLSQFSEYVNNGGKLFMVYQSFPKYYFSESMETNTNELLQLMNINDRVVFDFDETLTKQYGSIKLVDNETRLKNTSRKQTIKLKKHINKDLSQFKALMNPGHYYHRNSDLDQACSIVEFNATDSKKVTSVFWKSGKGIFGIGTEVNSSGAANTNVYNAWKLIHKVLMNQSITL